MKKSLLALAVLSAIAGSATAQSSVTMYGIMDAGVVHESGNPSGSVTKLTSGVTAGSRLGFRGVEDLGGGVAAVFLLETGITIDTGGNAQGASTANPAGTVFARQNFVGLKSNNGTLTMGRQYNPYFKTVAAVDPFGAGGEGNSGNLVAFTGSNGRSNNSILYVSPSFSGFSGELLYGFGEVAGDTKLGRVINGAVQYANGPLMIRAAMQRQNAAPASALPAAYVAAQSAAVTKNAIIAASYNFDVVKLSALYATVKGPSFTSATPGSVLVGFNAAAGMPYNRTFVPPASADTRDFLLGATIPFGVSNVQLSYIDRKDKTASAQDAKQMAIGYEYNVSKRTALYAQFSHIKNDNGAAYTVGNAGDITAGSGDKGYAVGVRHTF
ncbi:porin [Actimicrobium sp. CCC2.4]|uniref:porin n=1 Tax=Actimicrobium sp. CCC2.4 TaxID=3048606 RepID=UPI002AC98683|nr:porin [Actimicrobium sp. CCC2.4]MEB0134372.1 porin [Actimicrobium sp. CCC2.4]WPX33012.1 porin [Actimicrobium sp. CCC2.4]